MSNDGAIDNREPSILVAPTALADRRPEEVDARGETLYILRGAVTSAQELLASIAEAGQFPELFGMNWNALKDSLCDLEWLPATSYTVVWPEASEFLRHDVAGFTVALEVFRECSEWWHEQGIRFRLVIADDYLLRA